MSTKVVENLCTESPHDAVGVKGDTPLHPSACTESHHDAVAVKDETPLPLCRFMPSAEVVPLPIASAGVPHSWSSFLSLLVFFCLGAMVYVVQQEGSIGLTFLVPCFLLYSFYFFIVVDSGGRNLRQKLLEPISGDPTHYVAALQRSQGTLWLNARCTSEVRTGDHETRTDIKYVENEMFPHACAAEQTPTYGLPPGSGPIMLHLSMRVGAVDALSQNQLDAARRLQQERCKGKAACIELWEVYSLMPEGADTVTPLQLYAKPRFEDAVLWDVDGSMPWWCSARTYWLFSVFMLHSVFVILINRRVRGAWVCLDRALEVQNA